MDVLQNTRYRNTKMAVMQNNRDKLACPGKIILYFSSFPSSDSDGLPTQVRPFFGKLIRYLVTGLDGFPRKRSLSCLEIYITFLCPILGFGRVFHESVCLMARDGRN